jgi:cytidyltransferase-like protein
MNWDKKTHVKSSLPAKKGQYAMFVGRWQPLHTGHQELFKRALDEDKNVLICIRDIQPDEKKSIYRSASIGKYYRILSK